MLPAAHRLAAAKLAGRVCAEFTGLPRHTRWVGAPGEKRGAPRRCCYARPLTYTGCARAETAPALSPCSLLPSLRSFGAARPKTSQKTAILVGFEIELEGGMKAMLPKSGRGLQARHAKTAQDVQSCGALRQPRQ